MHQIAQDLNDQIRSANPYIYELLSDLGRELYYPKGILTQSAEAKQKHFALMQPLVLLRRLDIRCIYL